MKNLLYLALFVCFLSSCEQPFESDLLIGEWETLEYKNANTNELINQKMDMIFGDDGAYVVDYGTMDERGKYWLSGFFLHTVEQGQSEKKVKVTSLSRDTLKLEMNRAGVIETVLLAKRK